MIQRRLQAFVVVATLCGPNPVLAMTRANSVRGLPQVIASNLDRRFPGWKLALPNDNLIALVNRDRKLVTPEQMCIARGDFDGNGALDYVVHIAVGPALRETRLIVYLRNGSRYWHRTLERGGPSTGELYVTVAPKGMQDFDYTNDRTIRYRLPTIMFGGEKGGYSYLYARGRFSRIISSD
jgi:hypothetical protein